jgi:DNA polymerase-3 subunit epsilon
MIQGQLFATAPLNSVVVFDVETTGMSPQQGDRVIEVGAVRLEGGKIVDQFQSLVNPEISLDPYITELTGITNLMLVKAPEARTVIADFYRFVDSSPLVAHNASFDRKFIESEFERYSHPVPAQIGCSMLAARRIFPEAPNHKLGTLISYLALPSAQRFHRALEDASMTAMLWRRLEEELVTRYGFSEVPFSLLDRLGQVPSARVHEFLNHAVKRQHAGKGC